MANTGLPEEESWRADTYRLLAALLLRAPTEGLLDRLGALSSTFDEPVNDPLAAAWKELATRARLNSPEEIAEEYLTLFIGPPRGELMPYASWYLTGFLMEKPLAELRKDLARLGIARRPGMNEPEDHVAALCESLCLLISSGEMDQAEFFARHLHPWVGKFFLDLRNAGSARFYRAVAELGLEFIRLERACLGLEDTPSTRLT